MKTLKSLLPPPLGAGGLHTMNILLFAALTLGGCNTKDPIATTPVPTADYSIINGDTIKTVINKDYKKAQALDPNSKNYIVVGDTIVTYREPKLHTPPTKDPDLSKLKNNDDPDLKGKPLRYVAIGGSLTAGVRDGGYFNEGILTSYPNLIARQMKLQKFEQPLFDATDYNGFGRKVRTGYNPTGEPVPKFNTVKNNSGVEGVDEKGVKLKPYKVKGVIDNFAMPDFNVGALHPFNGTQDYERFGLNSISKEFFYRMIPNNKSNSKLTDKIFSNKFDIISIEFGYMEVLTYLLNAGSVKNGITISDEEMVLGNGTSTELSLSLSPELSFLRKVKESKGVKGCILNIPNFSELRYFNLIDKQIVEKALGNMPIRYGNSNSTYYYSKDDLMLPFPSIDSLLSTKVHIALKKGVLNNKPLEFFNILPQDYIKDISSNIINKYNIEIVNLSKKFGFPIVDIKGLYEKILRGNYMTDDGVKIDASYPNGNFFSTDGIYPTALGQAIIANEVIKTLNSFYKMDTPLISTKEYLNLK